GFRETAGAHIDIGEEIERLRKRGTVAPRRVLTNRKGAFVIFLGLGIAAFPEIRIAEIFQGVTDDDRIAAGVFFYEIHRALLYRLRFCIAALMLINAPEPV